MSKEKIAIIGPYPPPFGGISVHIQRVLNYLPEEKLKFYNTSKSTYPGSISFYGKTKYFKVWIFLFKKYKIVHTHSTDPLLRIFFGLIGIFRKNIYMHIQGASLTDYLSKKDPFARVMKLLIRNLHILACNSELLKKLEKHNPRTINEIDAFIPPVFNSQILRSIVHPYKEFFQKDRFIISTTGWFDLYNGQDLYGFNLMAELIYKFKKEGILLYLVASINGIRNQELFNSFLKYLHSKHLQEQVLLIQEDLEEIWPLFIVSQVFLRATITDGSAVSVKEALWFDTPVIASDCTVRPQEVILFKNQSINDLYEKMLYVYHKPRISFKTKINNLVNKKFSNKLFSEIYGLQ